MAFIKNYKRKSIAFLNHIRHLRKYKSQILQFAPRRRFLLKQLEGLNLS
jgi:hypothetical protein